MADAHGYAVRAFSNDKARDALVNAAAIMTRGTILDIDEGAWDRTFAVNVKGTYPLTRMVLPLMIAQGGGAIVNSPRPRPSAAPTTSRGAHPRAPSCP
jgi:2-keto-3-deoxy-L-fuconate dehydrogenase